MENIDDSTYADGPEAIDRENVKGAFEDIGSALAIVAGGAIIFGWLFVPHRCAGATRSGRLIHEEREAEILRAITTSSAPDQNPANQVAGNSSPNATGQ